MFSRRGSAAYSSTLFVSFFFLLFGNFHLSQDKAAVRLFFFFLAETPDLRPLVLSLRLAIAPPAHLDWTEAHTDVGESRVSSLQKLMNNLQG